MDRFVGWVNGRLLLKLAFVVFSGGVLLLCVSFVLGIDSVTDPASGHEVGYAGATNWNAPLLFLLPLLSAGLAWLVHALARLFPGVQERMLTPAGTDAGWRDHLRGGLPWLFAFAVVATAMSAYECWHDSYRALFALDTMPEQVSWTTAAVVEEETVSRGVNFAFVAVAWAFQTLAKLLVGILLWQSLTLGVWLAKHGLGFARARLVPDLADPDPRCGFQRFELPGALLFGTVALFVMVVWLVVAQNLYYSNVAGATGMWDHAFDYGSGRLTAPFSTGGFAAYDVFWARVSGLAVMVLTLVLVGAVMIPVAMRSARAYALEHVEEIAAAQGVPTATARERLRAMPAWPYGFISAPALGFVVVFGAAGLWFFRLAPWALLATIAVVSLRARGRLMRGGHVRVAYAGLIGAALLGAVMIGKALHTNTGTRGIVPGGRAVAGAGYRPEYANSHALLIGIGYENSPWPRLPNAERDVAKLKETLEATAGAWKISTLLGGSATRAAILDELARLVDVAARDDRVFVFYAGHGGASGETNGWIMPADAKNPDPGKSTWIYSERFRGFLSEIQAKHVLLALDCCYSGRTVRAAGVQSDPQGATLEQIKAKYLKGKAQVVISSGRGNEVVADGPVGGHSPFAAALFDALKSPRKAISAPVLYGRIYEALSSANQTPQIDYVHQDGQFLFFPNPE